MITSINNERKHYLVTGGAGFIGINLSFKLIEIGHSVSVVDNLFCGDKNNLPDKVKFYEIDIKDINDEYIEMIENESNGGKLDGIFNLACPGSPKNYKRDSFFTINTCTTGILNILNIACRLKIPVVHTSSAEVYGDTNISPQAENYKGNVNCNGYNSCYSEGKRIAETICYEHNSLYDTDVRVVRIFDTYGPYMDLENGRVISNFITQALEDKKLTIYGSGSQTRTFCYISDIVKGLISCINLNTCDYKGVINLGSTQQYQILELALVILSLTGKYVNMIRYCKESKDDPINRNPDISKAKKLLRWNHEISLDQGLIKTIIYFQKVLKNGINN